jgi:hypothetical protein
MSLLSAKAFPTSAAAKQAMIILFLRFKNLIFDLRSCLMFLPLLILEPYRRQRYSKSVCYLDNGDSLSNDIVSLE